MVYRVNVPVNARDIVRAKMNADKAVEDANKKLQAKQAELSKARQSLDDEIAKTIKENNDIKSVNPEVRGRYETAQKAFDQAKKELEKARQKQQEVFARYKELAVASGRDPKNPTQSKNKPKKANSKKENKEFLFEAPFLSSTAQFISPSEVPFSANIFYPTQLLIEREYQNQWLFEVLPSGENYESGKKDSVLVRHQTYRFTGADEKKQKDLIALLAQNPGNAYEKMVIARFQFGEGGKIATRMPDGTAFGGKIPVEITLSKDWWTNSRKRKQIETYLEKRGKVMLVVPFYDKPTTDTSIAKLKELGEQVWAKLPAKKKTEFKNFLDIRLVLT